MREKSRNKEKKS